MKTLALFTALLFSTFAAAQNLQHTTDLQTPLQRATDPTWMHIPQQHTPLIVEGKLAGASESFLEKNFVTQTQNLKSLEIAHVSITQPIYWARWEKNRNLLIATAIFTLKFNGKSWSDAPGSFQVLAHISVHPHDFNQIQLIQLLSFRDSQLKNKWSKTEEAHLQIDRDFINAVGKPALTYYFNQPDVKQSWKDRITDAFGSFCFKYQVLSGSEACKSQAFKPQQSPVQ